MALLLKLIKNSVKYSFLTIRFLLDTPPETEARKNKRKQIEEEEAYYEFLRDVYKIHT